MLYEIGDVFQERFFFKCKNGGFQKNRIEKGTVIPHKHHHRMYFEQLVVSPRRRRDISSEENMGQTKKP